MSDTKIQWHPGFVAAMALEFGEDRDDLIYEREVAASANEQLVERLIGGEDKMSKTLLRIMKPEIDKLIEDKVQDETRNAIRCAVESFRELGADDEQIKGLLVKNHKLTLDEAAMYL